MIKERKPLFFWTKNEWGPCFLDTLYIHDNEPREGALGWSNKVWHFFCCWLLTIHLWFIPFFFGWNIASGIVMFLSALITFILGFLWEVIVDCWLTVNGASKLDLLVDGIGCIMGVISLWCIYLALI